jgi:hypothetical protein
MFRELYSKGNLPPFPPLPPPPFLPIQNWFERGLAFLLPSKELLGIKRGRKGVRRRERGQQCCGSGSGPAWIRNILGSWIRIPIKWKAGSGSAPKLKSGSLRGSFWSIGGSKSEEQRVVGSVSGSAIKLKVRSGSPSKSNSRSGSGPDLDPQHCRTGLRMNKQCDCLEKEE